MQSQQTHFPPPVRVADPSVLHRQYRKAELDQDEANWGRTGKNVWVVEAVDVPAFWKLFEQCVASADQVSPLNK